MSLNQEIAALEAERKEAAKQSLDFYKTVNVPGVRTMGIGNAKAAVAEMKKLREAMQ
ncbi:MAG: hypothetical protein AAGK97_11150 [Bacteroidota bacterium]